MSSKNPKFFCEFCSNEVKRNTRICPHCGRFFASIKCPQCGFLGSESNFKTGCPKCGYAVQRKLQPEDKLKNTNKKTKNNYHDDESLPLWIYLVVAGMIALVVLWPVLK